MLKHRSSATSPPVRVGHWWDHRGDFDLYVSEVVLRECKEGDSIAATRRLDALNGIALLSLTWQAADLAAAMLTRNIMPAKAAEDALHIAIAAVHRVDFLLSWNFKHIANPVVQARIAALLVSMGLALPFICAPEELLGEDDE